MSPSASPVLGDSGPGPSCSQSQVGGRCSDETELTPRRVVARPTIGTAAVATQHAGVEDEAGDGLVGDRRALWPRTRMSPQVQPEVAPDLQAWARPTTASIGPRMVTDGLVRRAECHRPSRPPAAPRSSRRR